MHLGLHHAEKRKKEGTDSFFDRLMIVVGVIGPLAFVPQVLKIWVEKNATGISMPSWILLTIVSSMWLLYGIFHRSKALIVCNLLITVFNILIVIGVLAIK